MRRCAGRPVTAAWRFVWHLEFYTLSDSLRPAPLVLAHGLFGFHRVGIGPWTLAEYFARIPAALREAGFRVMSPRVHPTAGVERRARVLARRIDAMFPGEAVHLIGHSMGGLDSRVLATLPGWEDRVLSLTTIGTPHLGTSLAESARGKVGLLYRLIERLGWEMQGFLDVTPEAAERFNERYPLPEHIPCFSIGGSPSDDRVAWFLKPSFRWLEMAEGPNDGLVGLESALGFGTPLPPWPYDHLAQLNWFEDRPKVSRMAYQGVLERYLELAEALTRVRRPLPERTVDVSVTMSLTRVDRESLRRD